MRQESIQPPSSGLAMAGGLKEMNEGNCKPIREKLTKLKSPLLRKSTEKDFSKCMGKYNAKNDSQQINNLNTNVLQYENDFIEVSKTLSWPVPSGNESTGWNSQENSICDSNNTHSILAASVYLSFAFCCTKASITLLFWRKEIKAQKLFDLPLRAVVKGRAGPEPDQLPLPSVHCLVLHKSDFVLGLCFWPCCTWLWYNKAKRGHLGVWVPYQGIRVL